MRKWLHFSQLSEKELRKLFKPTLWLAFVMALYLGALHAAGTLHPTELIIVEYLVCALPFGVVVMRCGFLADVAWQKQNQGKVRDESYPEPLLISIASYLIWPVVGLILLWFDIRHKTNPPDQTDKRDWRHVVHAIVKTFKACRPGWLETKPLHVLALRRF